MNIWNVLKIHINISLVKSLLLSAVQLPLVRSCYHQNASNRKMKGMEVVENFLVCKLCSVLVLYKIRRSYRSCKNRSKVSILRCNVKAYIYRKYLSRSIWLIWNKIVILFKFKNVMGSMHCSQESFAWGWRGDEQSRCRSHHLQPEETEENSVGPSGTRHEGTPSSRLLIFLVLVDRWRRSRLPLPFPLPLVIVVWRTRPQSCSSTTGTWSSSPGTWASLYWPSSPGTWAYISWTSSPGTWAYFSWASLSWSSSSGTGPSISWAANHWDPSSWAWTSTPWSWAPTSRSWAHLEPHETARDWAYRTKTYRWTVCPAPAIFATRWPNNQASLPRRSTVFW